MVDQTGPQPSEILVVEDEQDIRLLLRHALQHAGFVVHEAATGEEGLQTFRAHAGTIGMVIADLGLPGMDGFQAVQAMREQQPDLRFFLLSGGSGTFDWGRVEAAGPVAIFDKPF
jgi:CheY-like chemotaxis protein